MRSLKPLLLIAVMAVSSSIVNAQVFKLNTINTPTEERLKAANGSQSISINREIFEDNLMDVGSELEVELSTEVSKNFTITRKTSYRPGTISYIAKEDGSTGSVFSFTFGRDKLIGLMFNQGTNNLEFTFEEDTHLIKRRSAVDDIELQCDLDDDDITEWTSSFTGMPAKQKSAHNHLHGHNHVHFATDVDDSRDDDVVIDLLIVFTAAARQWALFSVSIPTIDEVIAQAMNLSQTALDNSNTRVILRLVDAVEIDYDETTDGVSSGDRLRRLTASPTFLPSSWSDAAGYMDEVHDLRDQTGADIVSLLADVDDTGGIAWVVTDPNGEERLAFNLNRVQQVATGFTMVHEIGHNLGNFHSRTQSVQTAPGRGGLHHYSVGYQTYNDSLHSVMAYSASGLSQAPVFSGPDVFWNNVAMGRDNNVAPENASQSIRDTKRTVSAYRTTQVDIPVVNTNTDEINVEVNLGESLTIPFDITNTGNSQLFYEIDFEFTNPVIEKRKTPLGRKLDLPIRPNPFNYRKKFVQDRRFKGAAVDTDVYSSSFESEEGYFISIIQDTVVYEAINGWTGLGGDDFIQISKINPFVGNQHLRLGGVGNIDGHFLESPYLGRQPFGNYEFSMDFMLNGSDVTSEVFDLNIFDRKKKTTSGGVIISGGFLSTYTVNEIGVAGYYSTTVSVSANEYHNLLIRFNTDDQIVEYYLDGILARADAYVDGFTPDEFWLVNREITTGGNLFEVDNIQITRNAAPFSWLLMNSFSGSLANGQTKTTNLNFETQDVLPGTYAANMIVRSNDSNNPAVVIPIQLNVTGTVSNEEASIPDRVTLNQNFPNPFNPTTNITYELARAEQVSIDVYNIQGQKVSTLVNSFQSAGEYSLSFDASNLSSGIYIYTLRTPSTSLSRRMVLIK